jgi:formate dehydrogenase alpha subunit
MMIKISIDGRNVEARPGTTVLETAKSHGIYIPNLCSSRQLAPYGGCRLCLVEIKGKRGYPPACCTYVEDGLEIQTETAELQTMRRHTLELILSEHPHACLICTEKKNCDEYKSTIRKVGEVTGCVLCPANGDCRLQEAVEHIKPERVNFPAFYRQFEVHREDPFFDRNYNLCILCGRCVRVCNEVRGASVVSFVYRGPQAVIETAFDRPLLDSACQFCGACVDVCPTGALNERAVKGQGIPQEKRDALCPLCGIGCTLEAGVSHERILGTVPKEGDYLNDGQACVKGRFVFREAVHSPKRLLRPMIRQNGELVETGWDEVLDFAAAKLKAGSGGRAALVSSPQLSLEDQYVFFKFARDFWQAKPLHDIPKASAVADYWEELHALGIDPALNFELGSIAGAKSILVAGTNLTVSQPILWLEVLKAVRQGAALMGVNPEEPSIGRFASHIFRTKPDGEPHLLSALARLFVETGGRDESTVIPGHGEFVRSLEGLNVSQALAEGREGEANLISAARLLAEKRPGIILFGSGLAGRPDSGRIVRLLWNLSLHSGARVIPLADDNNERGCFELCRWLAEGHVREDVAQNRGKILYLAGEMPALRDKPSEFFLFQGCYSNDNVQFADAVLPAASFAETEGTYVNLEGRIQKSRQVVLPAGESRPDWWIFSQLARRMGSRDYDYQSQAEIAEELAGAVPALAEVARHHKKGRPAFVAEFPDQVRHFVPVPADAVSPEKKTGDARRGKDIYRGLNLAEEVKGLKRLREKSGGRHA